MINCLTLYSQHDDYHQLPSSNVRVYITVIRNIYITDPKARLSFTCAVNKKKVDHKVDKMNKSVITTLNCALQFIDLMIIYKIKLVS